jgi:hypothetical protein
MGDPSNEPPWPLDSVLPDVRFVLNWNPPKWKCGAEAEARTDDPPDTVISTIGGSRKATFYDQHFAKGLVLKRVVYLKSLVSALASTVDQAILDAIAKHPLPLRGSGLQTQDQIQDQMESFDGLLYREIGVATSYRTYAAFYCLPIASALALHPCHSAWTSLLNWTLDGKNGKWAIADGVLRLSWDVAQNNLRAQQILAAEDDEKKAVLRELARDTSSALAVWEMKSLTVGPREVMDQIMDEYGNGARFRWTKCTEPQPCSHPRLEAMKESKPGYNRGRDSLFPPWTLEDEPPSADDRPRSSRLASLRSASAAASVTGITASPSRLKISIYTESSSSSLEDGGRVGEKRNRKCSDEEESRPSKTRKSNMDSDDSYVPSSPRNQKEVNAQLFLQQVRD